ncbi:MAG TPA: exodeoxyribonuclease VII small subunit [Rhodocyclaceae bacterium]|nr:MAG: exodeoxyribonuclease VII small subunit [Betaproteobacteria bacterium CG2_30_68_42]PIV71395.1 MAG: exodeoxyribonuclease VII small subunit [Rhodocyclales bacterium CG17_big_fil_post_rev_8_21_14_2_50_68_7]PIX74972.1 MAG: exodeoxyribonuclease VII small subunit [Rhodocyclales bacterium CG_4_10_14_3_um_filter_68_10]PJA57768.1 MAG: exodeoxyribonuclease VII small subunit [Rhodocyclales bacterium CG_4_9_14_3_um_filter_68_10]HCX33683.1 exodeoxyribonuclease VII small subunit [Rhodocyclaceae bacter
MSEPSEPENFETALTELEALVRDMEAGKLSLDQSLCAYERGMRLLRYCQTTLSAAEQKVEVLSGTERGDSGADAGDAH